MNTHDMADRIKKYMLKKRINKIKLEDIVETIHKYTNLSKKEILSFVWEIASERIFRINIERIGEDFYLFLGEEND